MKTSLALLCAAGALATVAAPATGSGATVRVSEYKFRAKTVHVTKGSTVTWQWVKANGDPHNVTFHGFHSKTQAHGSFKHTFNKRGTFTYMCTIHNKRFHMRGTIIVG